MYKVQILTLRNLHLTRVSFQNFIMNLENSVSILKFLIDFQFYLSFVAPLVWQRTLMLDFLETKCGHICLDLWHLQNMLLTMCFEVMYIASHVITKWIGYLRSLEFNESNSDYHWRRVRTEPTSYLNFITTISKGNRKSVVLLWKSLARRKLKMSHLLLHYSPPRGKKQKGRVPSPFLRLDKLDNKLTKSKEHNDGVS